MGHAGPAALLLLGLLIPQDSLDDLIEKLASERVEEREEAQKRLVELGEKAEPFLRKAAESKDPELSGRAVAALARIAERREERTWLDRVRALPVSFKERRWKDFSDEKSL